MSNPASLASVRALSREGVLTLQHVGALERLLDGRSLEVGQVLAGEGQHGGRELVLDRRDVRTRRLQANKTRTEVKRESGDWVIQGEGGCERKA